MAEVIFPHGHFFPSYDHRRGGNAGFLFCISLYSKKYLQHEKLILRRISIVNEEYF
jgi:hypothetical protein